MRNDILSPVLSAVDHQVNPCASSGAFGMSQITCSNDTAHTTIIRQYVSLQSLKCSCIMKIFLHAPWEVNDYLDELIHQKVNKLLTFHDRLQRADVFLKTGDHRGKEDKIAEIRLRLSSRRAELFAQDQAESFEKAVTLAADKLRRQLIKLKTQH